MAIDLGTEFRRPVTIALAAAALLGWIVVIALGVSANSQKTRFRTQTQQAQAMNQQLASELASERQAAGTLSDLQAKITAAQGQLNQLNQTRDQAQTG